MYIEWSHVNKRFHDSAKVPSHRPYRMEFRLGLLDFTSTVRNGITAVLGPQGSGKTTLLRMTAGALVPDDGRITYHIGPNEVRGWSRSVAAIGNASSADELRKRIGYVPSKKRSRREWTLEESLYDIAEACGHLRPKVKVAEMMAKWGLAAHRKQLVKNLPEGVSSRYIVSQSLMAEPPIWLLDEPTESLDELGLKLLHEEIAERRHKGIILIATNDLQLAEVADYLLLMEGGSCRRLGQRRLLTAGVPDGRVSSWYNSMQTFAQVRTRFK
ncbi:ABC-2 type transport system ATP-binding protein/heme exporter protein A [Marininema mesophilum]|uniref:ABC-2 type transport system ATP-binding protein/heme exporter protein A n=1 Tax=Marininema mesophilum TaxID=1048340 RepID=A0A1H3BBQ5_9BACL|nr:ABC-2 type transport system ATP-binding protein/heme exporter protein A [Marininema mesophilum]